VEEPLLNYIFWRIGQAVAVVFGVTIITFVIIHLLPGGPARGLLGPHASAAQLHAFIVQNGYNRPWYVQYLDYIRSLASGSLGFSYRYGEPVTTLLKQAVPNSALLVGLSYLVALVVAIPVGLLQAAFRNKPVDSAITLASLIGYSMPVFWLGILLVLGFSSAIHLFPPEGPQGGTIAAALADPLALVLPVATLSIVTIALFSRYIRSSAIDSLVQDYIRTARSIGASHRRILQRHVLRNSLLPVITLLGLSLPVTLSGAVITESVFNYPGMGLLFWNAATTHDYPLLMGCVLVVGIATVIGSLLADLLYAVADPRVRYS
jgi:peptide/nickel transport system permease protein